MRLCDYGPPAQSACYKRARKRDNSESALVLKVAVLLTGAMARIVDAEWEAWKTVSHITARGVILSAYIYIAILHITATVIRQ